jgi:hypothetical protein
MDVCPGVNFQTDIGIGTRNLRVEYPGDGFSSLNAEGNFRRDGSDHGHGAWRLRRFSVAATGVSGN